LKIVTLWGIYIAHETSYSDTEVCSIPSGHKHNFPVMHEKITD